VQSGCILGGLQFRSIHTAIRFFRFVWCFQQHVFREFFPEKRLELKTCRGWTKAEEEGPPENGGTEGAPQGHGPSLKKYRCARALAGSGVARARDP
jgi:hypothetical protein